MCCAALWPVQVRDLERSEAQAVQRCGYLGDQLKAATGGGARGRVQAAAEVEAARKASATAGVYVGARACAGVLCGSVTGARGARS